METDKLRDLIGMGVVYRGLFCCVLEVLEDGPALVLQEVGSHTRQPDQFGEPRRAVPTTFLVPVYGADGAPNPEFLQLQWQFSC